MAESFGRLSHVVNFNGLAYRMQYEPHALKYEKEQIAASPDEAGANFQDHHFLTMTIDGLNPGLATTHQDNYSILSQYLNEEYKDNFSIAVNGERKACVLHHAMFPPQNPNQVIVQLVFKDPGYMGQADYFQNDISVIYFDKKNRETISWTIAAHELNQFPSLNNNYKNG